MQEIGTSTHFNCLELPIWRTFSTALRCTGQQCVNIVCTNTSWDQSAKFVGRTQPQHCRQLMLVLCLYHAKIAKQEVASILIHSNGHAQNVQERTVLYSRRQKQRSHNNFYTSFVPVTTGAQGTLKMSGQQGATRSAILRLSRRFHTYKLGRSCGS